MLGTPLNSTGSQRHRPQRLCSSHTYMMLLAIVSSLQASQSCSCFRSFGVWMEGNDAEAGESNRGRRQGSRQEWEGAAARSRECSGMRPHCSSGGSYLLKVVLEPLAACSWSGRRAESIRQRLVHSCQQPLHARGPSQACHVARRHPHPQTHPCSITSSAVVKPRVIMPLSTPSPALTGKKKSGKNSLAKFTVSPRMPAMASGEREREN